ncbi:MAG: uridine kinase [Chloroflexi bacterium]|nr:uridine kinase [Chloroflexota bacterium]
MTRERSTTNPILIIGVAGGTASGKTTVVQAILDRVGRERIAYIQHDSYYKDLSHLPLEERRKFNFDHPDALDTPLLVQHLKELRAGRSVQVPEYDFATYCRLPQTRTVYPRPVVIVEGILILTEPALRELIDLKIYVDTDADLRLIRRIQRDIAERGRTVESVIEQYLATVRPMHLEFVEPSKRYADVIIPLGGHNVAALELVTARILTLLDSAEPERD